MPDTLLTLLGSVLVASVTGLSMVLVSRVNTRGASKTATVAPYDKLADRVSKLEDSDQRKSEKITTLQNHLAVVISDRDSLVAYVKQWSSWFTGGAHPPPPPVPSHLRDLLDPADWEVAHITEHTTTTTRYVQAQPDDESAGP
jgi:hypothetical protein